MLVLRFCCFQKKGCGGVCGLWELLVLVVESGLFLGGLYRIIYRRQSVYDKGVLMGFFLVQEKG